ncbi:MAG: GNAT family N-acetyltransferase, partial [Oscillatoriaceae cyanobacterium Prado104]|nr:GNAT family N-acetyltransferase [Oscillatoriaceae cyanobacterium Prado104]
IVEPHSWSPATVAVLEWSDEIPRSGLFSLNSSTEAATRIIEYAFEELGFEYLIASCDRPNIESQKVAERLGMQQVEERTIDDNPTVFFRLDKSSIVDS